MKNLKTNYPGFAVLLFLLAFGQVKTTAQVFEAIGSGTSKEFASDPEIWDRTYALHIDSATQNGDTLSFHLANRINQNEIAEFETDEDTPIECFGWGACYENTGSAGFGVAITSTGPGVLNFLNFTGDTLTLNFSEADSSIIYQNDEESYALVSDGETEEEIFGEVEAVQAYKIVHHGNDGEEIDSPLHNFQIKIGTETGLLNFFQTDSFPTVERPLYLIGDQSHSESVDVLLSEDIYDFNIGDTIQYKITEVVNYVDIPVTQTTITYQTKILLDRIEEPDSIKYEILYRTFTEEDPTINEWIDETIYPRFDTIAKIPFYSTLGGPNSAADQEKISRMEFCDEPRIKLEGYAIPAVYCADHDAWCSFDTNGPPDTFEYAYVEGLGNYFERTTNSSSTQITSETEEIIYFSKNGNSCGNQEVLSTAEYTENNLGFEVFPNPAQNQVTIQSKTSTKLPGATVNILDGSGRVLMSHPWNGAAQTIDVSVLSPGLYLMQIVHSARALGAAKLVIE